MAVNKTQPKPVAGYKQHYHVFYFWVCLCVWCSTVHTLLFSGVEYKAEYKLWSRFVDLRKHVCVCVEEHNINGSRQSQVCNPFVLAASRRSHPQRQTLWWSERAPVRSCVCPRARVCMDDSNGSSAYISMCLHLLVRVTGVSLRPHGWQPCWFHWAEAAALQCLHMERAPGVWAAQGQGRGGEWETLESQGSSLGFSVIPLYCVTLWKIVLTSVLFTFCLVIVQKKNCKWFYSHRSESYKLTVRLTVVAPLWSHL